MLLRYEYGQESQQVRRGVLLHTPSPCIHIFVFICSSVDLVLCPLSLYVYVCRLNVVVEIPIHMYGGVEGGLREGER